VETYESCQQNSNITDIGNSVAGMDGRSGYHNYEYVYTIDIKRLIEISQQGGTLSIPTKQSNSNLNLSPTIIFFIEIFLLPGYLKQQRMVTMKFIISKYWSV